MLITGLKVASKILAISLNVPSECSPAYCELVTLGTTGVDSGNAFLGLSGR